jgi:hypothetical protein
VCSRLYGKGDQHMNFPNAYYDPELLKLMTDVLNAASIGRRPDYGNYLTRWEIRSGAVLSAQWLVPGPLPF